MCAYVDVYIHWSRVQSESVHYLTYEIGECVQRGLSSELLHTEERGGGAREGVDG